MGSSRRSHQSIKDRAAHAPNDLGFLIMEAPHCASLAFIRSAFLARSRSRPWGCEFPPTPGNAKKPRSSIGCTWITHALRSRIFVKTIPASPSTSLVECTSSSSSRRSKRSSCWTKRASKKSSASIAFSALVFHLHLYRPDVTETLVEQRLFATNSVYPHINQTRKPTRRPDKQNKSRSQLRAGIRTNHGE